MRLRGDVAESAVSYIAIELQRLGVRREPEVAAQSLFGGDIVARDEQIGEAVVVVIEKTGGEALPRFLHAGLGGHVGESAVMIIVVKKIVAVQIGDVEINVAVTVVISGDHALGEGHAINSGGMGDVFERAIAVVVKQLCGAFFATNKKIEIAVVVNIGPHGGLGAGGGFRESGG